MKLSKALVTVIITQLVAVATVIAQQKLSPDDLVLAVAIIAAVEAVGVIVAGQFATQDKIASIEREIKLFVQGKR